MPIRDPHHTKMYLGTVYYFRAPSKLKILPFLIEPSMLYVDIIVGGQCLCEGKVYKPGTIFCSVEGDVPAHTFPPGHPYRSYLFRFHNYFYQERELPRISVWKNPVTVRNFAQECLNAFYSPSTNPNALTQYAYQTIRWNAIAEPVKADKDTIPNELFAVKGLLDDPEFSYSEIGIDVLQQFSKYSIPHMRSLFKKHFGVSLYRYYLNNKLVLAEKLLADQDKTVNEVAFLCKFKETNNFIRLFKMKYGMSPGEYKTFLALFRSGNHESNSV